MWPSTHSIHPENERAKRISHLGIRVGEIIGYRAWRVSEGSWFRHSPERLCSVFISSYIWDPDKPASGDVRTHGIYSFRDVVRSMDQCARVIGGSPFLFGKVKIWGEVVEHEWGYRSEFARIVSLDSGNLKLLAKFRSIYGLADGTGSAVFPGVEL